MKYWTSTGVKCPLYAGESDRVVHCDIPCGTESLRVHVWLGDKVRKKVHREKYCKSISGCRKCPIYAAAEK